MHTTESSSAITAPGVRSVGIAGIGGCVPDRVLTNGALEQMVATSDAWIRTRTGIRERRVLVPGEATSDLAFAAAEQALADGGIDARKIELIVVATGTPDHLCSPSTASLVQHRLGSVGAAAFDVSAACSGFVTALMTADTLVGSGRFDNALVIGADAMSSVTDYEDRASCILFGDAAGAVLLQPQERGGVLLEHIVGCDGSGAGLIRVPAGGSRQPATHGTVERGEHFLRMDGRQVFKFAVPKLVEVVEQILAARRYTTADLAWLVPHQANLRILTAAAERLGMPMERVAVTVDRHGNTSSASIPTALDELARDGRLRRGDLVCLAAFGGGLTWGATLLRW